MRSDRPGVALALLVVSAGAAAAHAAEDGAGLAVKASLLQGVLYGSKQIDTGALEDLDVNGDGKVDINDLVDLNASIRDKVPLPPHRKTGRTPLLVPRYADQAWWVSDRLKAAVALRARLTALSDHDVKDWTRDVVAQVDALASDIMAAQHYGLVCGGEVDALVRDYNHFMTSTPRFPLEKWRDWIRAPAPGRDYVSACAQKMAPGPHRIHSAFDAAELCWTMGVVPFPYYTSVDFSVEAQPGGRLRVTMPVEIEFSRDFDPKEEREFQEWWTQNTQCMKDFWSRYGVDFALQTSNDAATAFRIHSGPGRSDISELYYKRGATFDRYPCMALTHEFGHRMGLPDRYIEKGIRCPDRKMPAAERKHEVMADGAYGIAQNDQFSREDLHEIFGSLCRGVQ